MRRKKIKLWVVLLGMALLLLACSPLIPDTGAKPGLLRDQATTSSQLESMLQELGAQVESLGMVPQPYFDQDALVLNVDGETVQVFEFPDATGADEAARLISPDGRRIGEERLDVPATPHFFKDQRLIVLYLGDDHAMLVKLATILGMPITHPRQPLKSPFLDEQNASLQAGLSF